MTYRRTCHQFCCPTDTREVFGWEWSLRQLEATEAERRNWQLLGDGYAIEWPDLSERICIEGVLAGRRSVESPVSLKLWLASHNDK